MSIETALMMLLRWFGSVALIILALAVITLLADRLRDRLTRTNEDEVSPPVRQLPPPVLLRPRSGESHADELTDPAPDAAVLDPASVDVRRRTPTSDAASRSDVVWEPEDVRAG